MTAGFAYAVKPHMYRQWKHSKRVNRHHKMKASYVHCQRRAVRLSLCNLPDLPSLPDLAYLVVQVQCEGGFTLLQGPRAAGGPARL